MNTHESWGKYFNYNHQIKQIPWRPNATEFLQDLDATFLPFGLGRSYGDSCLNDGGILLDMTPLNHFIAFDKENGVLRCEAGVSLAEILKVIVPHGWFLSVTPGTKFVTVGGAIANDVHGKNHGHAGTFGMHVTQFELLRSDGTRLVCSPTENEDWYRATIGGLGLTGIILWAEFKLKRIASPFIDEEIIKFDNLDEFFEIAAASEDDYEHTVSWIDCFAHGDSLGKGIFIRGNSTTAPYDYRYQPPKGQMLTIPFSAPNFALNNLTMRAFNIAYFEKQLKKVTRAVVHYEPFFYPLDAVGRWNRIYGNRGFMQYQCIVPYGGDSDAIRTIIHRMATSGLTPFLNVLKTFGDKVSPGMLSFPREGVTLAIDFPNQGKATLDLLTEIDNIVEESGGVAGYPAKDSRMSAEHFQRFFPKWKEFSDYIDPKISSSLWRRVMGEKRL